MSETPNFYELAYFKLFSQLTPAMQARVLAAKVLASQDSDKVVPDKEVTSFVKSVIALAEQDDK